MLYETHDPLERALALWAPAQPEPEGLFRKDDRPRVLVEGDSWVRKPRDLIIAGPPETITGWLETWGRWNLTNIGSPGDEAVAMLAGAAKLSLCERLDREHYDVILFSGGGNDIVGAYDFHRFILPRDHATPSAINWSRLENALAQIFLAYKLLIDLVRSSKSNSGTPIVTHTYDLAIPSPQGATFLRGALKFQKGRSWMHPYLVAKGWTDPGEQREIVATILRQFKNALINLSLEVGDAQGFHVVDTHGLLLPEDWKDEIHGTSEGFEKIAHKIEEIMIRVSLRKPAEAWITEQVNQADREAAQELERCGFAPPRAGLLTAEELQRQRVASDAALRSQQRFFQNAAAQIFEAEPWTGADVIENAASLTDAVLSDVLDEVAHTPELLGYPPAGTSFEEPFPYVQRPLATAREALVASLEADAERRAAEKCAAKIEAWLRVKLKGTSGFSDWSQGRKELLWSLLTELPEVLGAAAPADAAEVRREYREKVEAWLREISEQCFKDGDQKYADFAASLIVDLPEVLKP